MKTFQWDWVAIVYGRNLGLTFLVFGGLHWRFYTRSAQGERFMLNRKAPTVSHPRFLFGNQVRENMFWTAGSAVAVWSAYEVVTLWAFANGYIPMLNWEAHPVYFVALFCAIPIIRDAHFYLVHRLLHVRWLYRNVHQLHHKNMDIGPWSGMSMHPVEHILYFSGALLHWVLLSHPLHVIFHVQATGLSPAMGHVGYHKWMKKDGTSASIGQRYFHYLHHRYFECNYGGDGTVPLDKWFGTWHDGTPESHATMRDRRKEAHGV
jgi:sterol desaturase/sphingolipid hydroxylase (fatty acid hydroxylase superfamily)